MRGSGFGSRSGTLLCRVKLCGFFLVLRFPPPPFFHSPHSEKSSLGGSTFPSNQLTDMLGGYLSLQHQTTPKKKNQFQGHIRWTVLIQTSQSANPIFTNRYAHACTTNSICPFLPSFFKIPLSSSSLYPTSTFSSSDRVKVRLTAFVITVSRRQ